MSVLLIGIPKLIQQAYHDAKEKKAGLRNHVKAKGNAQKKLFTPGPIGVSMTTKTAMLRDVGSRDQEFTDIVNDVREKLVQLSGANSREYTCVPMQGSGTFALEAIFSTAAPKEGSKVLIVENGAYGKRLATICETLGVKYDHVSFPETKPVKPEVVRDLLLRDSAYNIVAMVHCETSSGLINPMEAVGEAVKEVSPECTFIVDAISSFGGVPLDLNAARADFMAVSANKCLEGVPGLACVLCQKNKLLDCKGQSRSLSLDLVGQYEGLLTTGQFRFTPPTHVILALSQALRELETEGGVRARAARYQCNRDVLTKGMKTMGFREFLDNGHGSSVITTYHTPTHPLWRFQTFYDLLNEKGQVIYPGKVTDADTFRIGTIGNLFPEDFEVLLIHIENAVREMGMPVPLTDGD